MRNHSSFKQLNNTNSCITNPYICCSTLQRKTFLLSRDYFFSNCNWSGCASPSNTHGGAICTETSGVTLAIDQRTFSNYSCDNPSSSYAGGSIFAQYITSLY